MTWSEFDELCAECEEILRDAAPVDTGHLREYGVQRVMYNNTCVLYIDETEAPYMKYTNEPWNNGKKNPNEGWFDRAAEQIAAYIANKLQGDIKS